MAQMAQLLSRRPKIGAMGEVKGGDFLKVGKDGKALIHANLVEFHSCFGRFVGGLDF